MNEETTTDMYSISYPLKYLVADLQFGEILIVVLLHIINVTSLVSFARVHVS